MRLLQPCCKHACGHSFTRWNCIPRIITTHNYHIYHTRQHMFTKEPLWSNSSRQKLYSRNNRCQQNVLYFCIILKRLHLKSYSSEIVHNTILYAMWQFNQNWKILSRGSSRNLHCIVFVLMTLCTCKTNWVWTFTIFSFCTHDEIWLHEIWPINTCIVKASGFSLLYVWIQSHTLHVCRQITRH